MMKTFAEEELRDEYTVKAKTNYDEAARLDHKAKTPAYILTYVIGIIGALILGVGMCLAMKVIGDGSVTSISWGIAIGIIGIALVAANYPLFLVIMKSRKEKYASAILVLLNKDEKK